MVITMKWLGEKVRSIDLSPNKFHFDVACSYEFMDVMLVNIDMFNLVMVTSRVREQDGATVIALEYPRFLLFQSDFLQPQEHPL